MTCSADAAADQAHSMMQDLADHWGLVVVMGVASIVIGFLAMFYPGATIVTVAIYFAAWLFVGGIGLIVREAVLSCRAAPTLAPTTRRHRPRPVARVLAPA